MSGAEVLVHHSHSWRLYMGRVQRKRACARHAKKKKKRKRLIAEAVERGLSIHQVQMARRDGQGSNTSGTPETMGERIRWRTSQ